MGGMNGHEFLRATVTADLIHWGVIGLVALASWLLTRYIVRRQKAQTTPTVPLPPLPQQWIGPCPLCPHCRKAYGVAADDALAPGWQVETARTPIQSSTVQKCAVCDCLCARIGDHLRGAPVCMDCLIKHLESSKPSL